MATAAGGTTLNCGACPACPACPAIPACPPIVCPALPPCVVATTQPADESPADGGIVIPGVFPRIPPVISGPKDEKPPTSPASPVLQTCCSCGPCPAPPPCNSTTMCPTPPPCNSTAAGGGGGGGLSTQGAEGLIAAIVGLVLIVGLIWSFVRGRGKGRGRGRRRRRRHRRRAGTTAVDVTVVVDNAAASSASSTPSTSAAFDVEAADNGSDSSDACCDCS